MQIDPVWTESVLHAVVAGGLTVAMMTLVLRWWRGRLNEGDAATMRARIAAAAPAGTLPSDSPKPVLHRIQGRACSDLGQRTLLASSFVGRGQNVVPLD